MSSRVSSARDSDSDYEPTPSRRHSARTRFARAAAVASRRAQADIKSIAESQQPRGKYITNISPEARKQLRRQQNKEAAQRARDKKKRLLQERIEAEQKAANRYKLPTQTHGRSDAAATRKTELSESSSSESSDSDSDNDVPQRIIHQWHTEPVQSQQLSPVPASDANDFDLCGAGIAGTFRVAAMTATETYCKTQPLTPLFAPTLHSTTSTFVPPLPPTPIRDYSSNARWALEANEHVNELTTPLSPSDSLASDTLSGTSNDDDDGEFSAISISTNSIAV